MKKPYKIIGFTLLIGAYLLWLFKFRYLIGDQFFNIAEWGGYMLILPLAYLFAATFLELTPKSIRTSMLGVFCGSCIGIFVNTSPEVNILLLKAASLFFGAIVVFLTLKYRN